MAIDFEHALTYARSLGSEFSVEELTRRFGGSKRDNAELAQRVKIRLAEDAAGARLQALENAKVPDKVRDIIKGVVAAVGEATLKLEDAWGTEHEQFGSMMAETVAATKARAATDRAEVERKSAENAEQLTAARSRIAELENALALVRTERDELALSNTELSSRAEAERRRADAAEAKVEHQRRDAEHEREIAERGRQHEARLSARVVSLDDLIKRQDATIERLHEHIARLTLPDDRAPVDRASGAVRAGMDGGDRAAAWSGAREQHGAGVSEIPCMAGRLNDTVRPWPG